MDTGISVIICCYNSSSRLTETLKNLAMQKVPDGILWEIILIDNASTDATARIARQEWDKFSNVPLRLTILEESRPGKNYAFRTGISASKYAYILTCDDDNWLSSGYVARAYQIMESDTSIGALGGHGTFEPEQPAATEIMSYATYYVNGSQSNAASRHWVYGAGSVYRKSVLTGLFHKGWQQITVGRKGNSLICGEDVELCFAIYLSGYKIVADNRLLFKHFVPKQRQKMSYINKLSYGHGYTNVLLNGYYSILNNDLRPFNKVLDAWLLSSTKTLSKSSVIMLYQSVLNRGKAVMQQRALLFSAHLGCWQALITNRKKIIKHHRQISALFLPADTKTENKRQ